MKCNYCYGRCHKKGRTVSGIQKYQCKTCEKYQREEYLRNGFDGRIEKKIIVLLKESCGIRSISRVLSISCTTVIKYIKLAAAKTERPIVKINRQYEADELKSFVNKKKNDQWLIYAIDKKTKKVVDFKVGKRSKRNIKAVIDTLLSSKTKRIYTDGLSTYRGLIPKEIHKVVPHNTNYIERHNLTLRTHLKRLSRKTICFSKSKEMLESCLRIYLWNSA